MKDTLRILLIFAACTLEPAFACGDPPDDDTAVVTVDLSTGGATTNGAPGGGGNGFCCIHPGGGYWTSGEVDPVTGQVMATQSAVRAACAAGRLQVRYLFSC